MKALLFLILCTNLMADELYDYKKSVLDLNSEKLWDLSLQKFETKDLWYFTDKPIAKIWYGVGACRVENQQSCKDCTCDYFFKSSHPNNRFIGDYPYNTSSEGYPQHPEKIPSSGCMDIDGARGKCTHQEDKKLCNISANVKEVFKAYIKVAFNDPNDPCGLNEFSQSKYFILAVNFIKELKSDKPKDNDQKLQGEVITSP